MKARWGWGRGGVGVSPFLASEVCAGPKELIFEPLSEQELGMVLR